MLVLMNKMLEETGKAYLKFGQIWSHGGVNFEPTANNFKNFLERF
jgi:hypothetical protein